MKIFTRSVFLTTLLFASFALITYSFAMEGNGNGGGQGMGNGMGNGNGGGNDVGMETHQDIDIEISADEPLSDFEHEALNHMSEEEYLALDVYTKLYELWGSNPFANISQSEAKHVAKVEELLTAYNLPNFSDHIPGVYENEELQKLYDDLIAKGSLSEVDAFIVGATIEDVDIYDLEEFLKEVENESVKAVFDWLVMGSENHMRAFNKQLEKNGVTYTAEYITPERLEEVLSGENPHHTGEEEMEAGENFEQEETESQKEKKGFWESFLGFFGF